MHEAALAGEPIGAIVRPLISESWHRVLDQGVDPDRGGDAVPLAREEVERRRRTSHLTELLPVLRDGLLKVADDAAHIMVVVDRDSRVLWREGSTSVKLGADRLGFVEGASWAECAVGTNAIGTAAVVRRPVQVYSAEHFVRTHHAWTCAAAPVRDPRDGTLLGVVDVSGPARTVHASTLALVEAVCRLAESQLRSAHHDDLARLRAVAAPVLARIEGKALVTDAHGWVAAASGLAPVDRVLLPQSVDERSTWLPAFGECHLEPLPGGWLIRPTEAETATPSRVVLDLRGPRHWRLTVSGTSGTWEHQLSPRHAELLLLLAAAPEGRTAAELAGQLFGHADRTVTVRAEMSRLRRHLGAVLDHRPYRFADWVQVQCRTPDSTADLLPFSTAPGVAVLRGRVDGGWVR
ncbi:MAG: GAF domain-containing protein [Streptosporangiales bacterium]|nr:GAF domain-containing protein [Streptosporangiales bacterium]